MKNKKIPSIKELKETYIDRERVHAGIDYFAAVLSLYITKLFLYTPIRPMQVMFLWFILQIVSCLIILKGGYLFILIGVFLYQAANLLDYVDGQVARYYGQESILALYVDQVYHWINHPLLFLCLSIAVGNISLGIAVIVVYFYARLAVFNPSLYNLQNKRLEKMLNRIALARQKKHQRGILSKLTELFRITLLFNAFFIGALFNVIELVLYLYLVLYVVEFFRRFIYCINSLKKIDCDLYGGNKK
ncbi:MAG: CDP-alcohol phosphatidyltransferase family protein [Nanoarchaeota archaeon]